MIGARSNASLVSPLVAVDIADTPEKTSRDLFPEIVLALSFPVAKLKESWMFGRRIREQKVWYMSDVSSIRMDALALTLLSCMSCMS